MATKDVNSKLTAIKQAILKRPVTASLLAAALVVAVLTPMLVGGATTKQQAADGDHSQHSAQHDQHGKNAHEQHVSAGAAAVRPGAGQDPAMQQQATLVAAASTPTDSGRQGSNPAAGVHGGHKRVDPNQVLSNSKHVSASGCVVGYGNPGEHCVPAHAPGGGPMTCQYVRKQFSGGIAVTGQDHLKLDANQDGTACGAGD